MVIPTSPLLPKVLIFLLWVCNSENIIPVELRMLLHEAYDTCIDQKSEMSFFLVYLLF